MLRSLNNRQFVILCITAAILLRLLLMPFFAHVDLFSEYRRLFYAIENDHLIANAHRLVTYYIEMIFAGMAMLVVPDVGAPFHLADPAKSTATIQDYYLFLQNPYVYRYLFIFKLPYLLFDIGVAAIIWRYIDDARLKRIALLLWLFNPLTLFATYIFGRFEVFSIFFLALAAYNLKMHRLVLASFMFALALHCREINLLLAPFFLIALIDFKDHWYRNIITVGGCALLIAALFLLPKNVVAAFGNINLFVDPDASHTSETINKLFSLGYYWFYPIIVGLSALAIYAWEIGNRNHAERFVICAAVSLCIYFTFNSHSIHYASWLVIFPILAMQYHRRVVLPFVALSVVWVCMWLLKTDAGVFTPFLAAPLSLELIGTGHFPSYFNEHLATENFTLHQSIQIMRSLFAVVMGFFCYRLLSTRAINHA